ncbi:response regulator [Propionivibrio sp.]|uniref:response regulator n=1 Tax=Propionivibrio sp. TaxID=2212460 RepID=UPI003BF45983
MSFFSKILSFFGKTEAQALPPKAVPVKHLRPKPVQPRTAPAKALPPKAVAQTDPVRVIASPSAPVERRSEKRLGTHKGRRVLIVDDSATIVAALRKILRSAGCITMEAIDAEKGLELVRQEKPDLVFLDIVLPGMNGFAALRLMRRDPLTQHIPVIMISGNEQATEEFYAKRIGADDFMKKPFSRIEVFARIEHLVEANKLARLEASVAVGKPTPTPVPPQVSSRPEVLPALTIGPPQKIAQREAEMPLAPTAVTPPAISSLEARTQLTAMGLQYFNQEQFIAAIERGDKLALQLFIAGGGINISEQVAENPA